MFYLHYTANLVACGRVRQHPETPWMDAPLRQCGVQASGRPVPGQWGTAGDGYAWHVLQTKSRQEKALAEALSAMQVFFFLPLICKSRYHGRRKVSVEVPLFPGYLFLRGSLEDAYEADRTRRVARIIKVVDQKQLDEELTSIWLALENQVPLDPYPALRKGIRVEVTAGPFRGIRGLIEHRNQRDHLILQVDMLGKAACLEIDGSLVEPI